MKCLPNLRVYVKLSILVQASFVIACEVKYFAIFTNNTRVLNFLQRGSIFLVFLYLFTILLGFLFNRGETR